MLVLALALPPGGRSAEAEVGVAATLVVNGRSAAQPVEAVLQGGTWYFAAAQVLQSLGLRAGWSPDGQQVTAVGQGVRFGFSIGDITADLNGAPSTLDGAPLMQNGAAFVPLSLLRLLGADASWNPGDGTLTVDAPGLRPTASVAAAAGGVEVYAAGGDVSDPAAGQALVPGDRIVTGDGGSAQIRLSDGSLVDVAPDSDLQLTQLGTGPQPGSRVASFTLVVGRILARIFDLGDGVSQLDVNTPTAVVGDRGTTFLVEVAPSGATTASVISGRITLAGSRGGETPVQIATGEASTVAQPGGQPSPPAVGRTVTVDSWLAGAVADAGVARAAEDLPPQAAPASQQALLQLALPSIRQALNQMGGRPFVGHVATSGGLGVDLTGTVPGSAGGVASPGNTGAPHGSSVTPAGGAASGPARVDPAGLSTQGGAGAAAAGLGGAASGGAASGGAGANASGASPSGGGGAGPSGPSATAGATATSGSSGGMSGGGTSTPNGGTPGAGSGNGSTGAGAGNSGGGGASNQGTGGSGGSSGQGGSTPVATSTATASGTAAGSPAGAGSQAGGHR